MAQTDRKHSSTPCGDASRKKGRPREFDRQFALKKALEVFWEKGYEPATLPDLCAAMGINPPSLYAAFGNKASLFLEAIQQYETEYWTEPEKRFLENPDLRQAIQNFFQEAATIILSPANPCGCMIVVAAVNISTAEKDIILQIRNLRLKTRNMFIEKLRMAINDGEIPADTDVPALANALNTFLEGMSLQAKDGLFLSELKAVANLAVKLLPQD